jgi:hypothetical protein
MLQQVKWKTGTAGQLFFWFGMGATIVVTVFVTHIARKVLKQVQQGNIIWR